MRVRVDAQAIGLADLVALAHEVALQRLDELGAVEAGGVALDRCVVADPDPPLVVLPVARGAGPLIEGERDVPARTGQSGTGVRSNRAVSPTLGLLPTSNKGQVREHFRKSQCGDRVLGARP